MRCCKTSEGQGKCKEERCGNRVNTGSGLYEAVCAGVGVGRLAGWVAHSAIEAGTLVRVCPAYRLVSSTGDNPQMHAVYG